MKAQTSTEFIVLLALGLTLTAIVVINIVDVSQAPNQVGESATDLYSETSSVQVANYYKSPEGSHIIISNSQGVSITLQSVQVNSQNVSTEYFPVTLRPNEQKIITDYAAPTQSEQDTITLTYCQSDCFANQTKTQSFSGSLAQPLFTKPLEASELLYDYAILYFDFNQNYLDKGPYGVQTNGNNTFEDTIFGEGIILSTSNTLVNASRKANITTTRQEQNNSWAFWFYHTGDSATTATIDARIDDNSYQYIFLSNAGGNYLGLLFLLREDAAICQHILISSNQLEKGETALWTLTQHSNGTVSLYVNTELQETESAAECTGSTLTGANVDADTFIVGAGSTNANILTISEYMQFNKTLTADEIRSLYQRGIQ